jgi:hypothetical protein
MLLLKKSSFDWAKEFLQSPAWKAILQTHEGTIFSFCLPTSRPSICISEISYYDSDETGISADSSSVQVDDLIEATKAPVFDSSLLQTLAPSVLVKTMPRAKRGKLLHISESELRRSQRLHGLNKGFKPSSCKNKSCLGCSSDPPSLSSSVVRELGSTFCNLDKDDLSDEALNSKPTKKG